LFLKPAFLNALIVEPDHVRHGDAAFTVHLRHELENLQANREGASVTPFFTNDVTVRHGSLPAPTILKAPQSTFRIASTWQEGPSIC
jgi:hypothetical protein